MDLENKEDNKAVVILTTKSGKKLGYVPAFYRGFMYDVIKNKGIYTAQVESINIYARPQLKVNISVNGECPLSVCHGPDFDVIEQLQTV